MSEPTRKDDTTLPTAQDVVNALTAQREGAHNALAQASALIAAQARRIAELQEALKKHGEQETEQKGESGG